jgi:hypothetical protein
MGERKKGEKDTKEMKEERESGMKIKKKSFPIQFQWTSSTSSEFLIYVKITGVMCLVLFYYDLLFTP